MGYNKRKSGFVRVPVKYLEKNFGVGANASRAASALAGLYESEQKLFLPSTTTKIIRQGHYTSLEFGQKLPTREADHALPFCASFDNAWSLTYATKTRGGVEIWLH